MSINNLIEENDYQLQANKITIKTLVAEEIETSMPLPSPPASGATLLTINPANQIETLANGTEGQALKIIGGELAFGTDAGTNTMSNVGTAGVGVYKQTVGVDFEMKKINAGSTKVSIADDLGNDEVDIDVNEGNINHNALLNYVANQHVDHSSVILTAGTNLNGGGDITASRTFNLDGDILGLTRLEVDNIDINGNSIISTVGNIELAPTSVVNSSQDINIASDKMFKTRGNLPALDIYGMTYKSLANECLLLPTSDDASVTRICGGFFGSNLRANAFTERFSFRYNNVANQGLFLDNNPVLTQTSLGVTVINSALTTVGTLLNLQVDNININGNSIISSDVGGDINITPDTTGNVVIDGQSWPNALGTLNQLLQTDASGNLSWTSSGVGGEANTASNQGAGAGSFKQKTGVDLELRSIIGGTNLTQVQNADDITLNLDGDVLGLTRLTVDSLDLNANSILTTANNLVLNSFTGSTDIKAGHLLRLREDNPTLDIFSIQFKDNNPLFGMRYISNAPSVNTFHSFGSYASNDRTMAWSSDFEISTNLSGVTSLSMDGVNIFDSNATLSAGVVTSNIQTNNTDLLQSGHLSMGPAKEVRSNAFTNVTTDSDLDIRTGDNGAVNIQSSGTGDITLDNFHIISDTCTNTNNVTFTTQTAATTINLGRAVHLNSLASDPTPALLNDGLLYYKNDVDRLRLRSNGGWVSIPNENNIVLGGFLFNTTSAVYTPSHIFHYAGSDASGIIKAVDCIIDPQAGTMSGRIYDFTNALVICEFTGVSGAGIVSQSFGAVSNVPTGPAILEIQILKSLGGGNISIYSATFRI
jgi:hypothetical protein